MSLNVVHQAGASHPSIMQSASNSKSWVGNNVYKCPYTVGMVDRHCVSRARLVGIVSPEYVARAFKQHKHGGLAF
jgi:hypothetical protein